MLFLQKKNGQHNKPQLLYRCNLCDAALSLQQHFLSVFENSLSAVDEATVDPPPLRPAISIRLARCTGEQAAANPVQLTCSARFIQAPHTANPPESSTRPAA